MNKFYCHKGISSFIVNLKPEIKLESWYEGAYSVHRGPLMFSVPLGLNFSLISQHFGYPD